MILYVSRKSVNKGESKIEVWGMRISADNGRLITQKIIRGKTSYYEGRKEVPASINQRFILCMTWAFATLLSLLSEKEFLGSFALSSEKLIVIYNNDVVCKWIEKETPAKFRVICGNMFEKIEQLPFSDIKLINSRANSVVPYLQYENIEQERYRSVLDMLKDME